ncbi:MAG: carboxyl transferase domain-containing protein [Ruminococcus sp.]
MELFRARGARKAAEFVKFCDAFEIPVLTLTNVNGFKATVCSEKMMAKSVGATGSCICSLQLYRRLML